MRPQRDHQVIIRRASEYANLLPEEDVDHDADDGDGDGDQKTDHHAFTGNALLRCQHKRSVSACQLQTTAVVWRSTRLKQ